MGTCRARDAHGDSFTQPAHLPLEGSWHGLRGEVEHTLVCLHMGWGKPKAAGEMSLGKRVLFPKDVIYVAPQTRRDISAGRDRQLGPWAGQCRQPWHSQAFRRDRLLQCSQFVFSMAEPTVSPLWQAQAGTPTFLWFNPIFWVGAFAGACPCPASSA